MTQAIEFKIESPAFQNRADIPIEFTCEGQDVSPPLKWSGAPNGTKSFVLIVDDPDAPDPAAPLRIWVHWLVYNIPAETRELGRKLPEGAQLGMSDFKKTSWAGPCPPKGKHRYFHKLYALDTDLNFSKSPSKQELESAMKDHILGTAELVGLFEKQTH